MLKRVVTGVFVLSLALVLPASSQVIVPGGTSNTNNCIPFGCGISIPTDHYQQVYAAASFGGAFSITSLSFFLDVAGNLNSGSFTFSLSTTSAGPATLSNIFANNIGGDNALFGTFVLGGETMPPILDFVGNAFAYNPAAGNLLLDIQMSSVTHSGPISSLEAFSNSNEVGRAYGNGPSGAVTNNFGLTTEFNRVAVVPEPATVFLLATGILGIALCRRRKGMLS